MVPVDRIMCHRKRNHALDTETEMTRRLPPLPGPTNVEYLEARFREYFPNASIGVIEDFLAERITVTVHSDGWHTRTYIMDIGSDDDCFTFTNNVSGKVITVPLQPEHRQLQAEGFEHYSGRHPILTGKEG